VEDKIMYCLDVVIPVKSPSSYLSSYREYLFHCDSRIRLNYVLDFGHAVEGNKIDKDIIPKALKVNERLFLGNYGSPGLSRNIALKKSDSKYVAFWDIDDKPIFEESLALINRMEENQAQLGFGGWTSMEGKFATEVTPLSMGLNPGLWRLIFSRDLVGDLNFSSANWGEDQEFIASVLAMNPKVFTSNNLIYRYRMSSYGSQTSQKEFVRDLPGCLKSCIFANRKTKASLRVVSTILIFRQFFTIIKYGDFLERLRAVWLFLGKFIKSFLTYETLISFLLYSKKWS
jgi:hypothetical protein